MMYTPTPVARRPRPPGSLTRPRTVLEQPGSGKALPSHPSVSSSLASSSSQPDAPLSTYIRRRQEYSRTGLARISASPGEVGDVSLGLDVEESKPIGLGLLSSVVEPSPPPPYGITLPDAPTPPRQDSGVLTRHSSEFRLEMELEEDEGEMSEEDVKVSLRAMRESLRLREDELAKAASVLHQLSPRHNSMSDHHLSAHHHDPILGFSNYLSSPLSFSPPPPDRPFRTIRATATSLPFPLDNSNTKTRPRHTSSSHPSPHYVRLQAETDERIASLEQALAEARESEDAQRKLAARLRRDFDKLQRDFERAERRMLREPVDVPVVATPKERDGWRRTENTIDRDLRATYARAKAEEERRIGWRSTAFPDFAPGPSRSRRVGEPELGEVTERLGRMKVDTIVTERPTYTSMVSSSSVQQIDEMTSPGSTTSVGSTTVQRAETLSRRSVHRLTLPLERRKVRKMVSPAKFAGPSKRPDSTLSTPLSPRLRVEVVSPPPSTFSPPHGSYRESPYPSPQPHATTASPTSLSSKIASMRTYVTAKLGLAASPTLGRTLGSELGSDFGDDRERRLRSLEDINPATSEDDSDQYSEPPAPLPPHVSAALSSLAIALAPHHDTSSPIPSKGSLREPGLEVVAYELLSEAVRVRRINWADTDKHLEVFAPNLAWGKPAESGEASEYPDEVSESNTALRPARLDARPRARPMAIRTVSSGTNTSLALAHRRRPSNLVNEIAMSSLGLGMDGWEEPRTIPAKVVHDLICLIAIVADCVEGVVVVLYRVMIDIRYGRRAILGLRRRAKMRRYYF